VNDMVEDDTAKINVRWIKSGSQVKTAREL